MTLPLVVLAAFSVGVGWGWPVWDAEASYLGHLLHEAEPAMAAERFHAERTAAHEYHLLAGGIGLLRWRPIGTAFAAFMYVFRNPAIALSAATPLITLFAATSGTSTRRTTPRWCGRRSAWRPRPRRPTSGRRPASPTTWRTGGSTPAPWTGC